MGIIFKDTVGNTNTNQTVLYLQSKTIKANTSVQWNNKIQGYFYNNNSTTTQLIVKSGIGDLNIVMQPYEKFSFPYVDINSVSNVSQENDITMYFSNSEFGFFSTSNNVFITNSSLDMNLTNTSVDVNLLNSTVEISNSSLDMNLLNASVDVNLLNSTVEISNPNIDVNVLNSSLDMNLLNSSLDVNLLNSTVEISNSSIDTNILNSSLNANILNASIDMNIIASSITMETDLGNISLDSQENQTSGLNKIDYNPWGFSIATAPTIDTGTGTSTTGTSASVQQNNARGLIYYFRVYVYNPTSASASADLTLYLYSHLPAGTNGSSGNPINSLTFSTGSIDATSGVWLIVYTNIFWEYNTLVVIPQQTIHSSGTAIGIPLANIRAINSHYWTEGRWGSEANPALNGVATIFWALTNTATASLPVTVQGGEVAITGQTHNLDMNLLNSSVDVNLLNSTVEISNSSLDMNLLNASVDVNLLNSSVDVNLLNSTVEISNSSIDANITNSSLDMNLLNASVDVNLLNSTVEISNSSIDANILNSSIDINIIASTVTLDTDLGNISLDSQENQTSGTNIYTYNPWGFNTSSTPSIRVGTVNNYEFSNVQQNGARGYLSFSFYVYNPTSTSGSTTISVNLYSHLPETNAPSPIMSFSFNTGTIDATSGVWLQVTPSIFWEYNTLVVIPEQQSGTQNSTIGIALPSNYNAINSHFWTGSYWDRIDDGFIGYWEIWNTSVASLPVTVQGGEVTITSTRKNPLIKKGSFTGKNGTTITIPPNKKWKIRSIVLYWTAKATQTDYVEIQIVPNSVPLAYVLNIYYGSIDVTENDSYGVDVAEYVQSRTNQTINGSIFSLTEQTVNKDFEMYTTELLYLTVDNETASVDYYISYIEENIN